MKAGRYIMLTSLSEPIDTKQKSRISDSLNTFLCFYSIKRIMDCFYYTYSLAFLLSTLPYSFIFNSCFGFFLSSLSFFLPVSPISMLLELYLSPSCLNSDSPSAAVACQASLHIIRFSANTIVECPGPSK